jgi:hypothetical protein
MTCLPKLVEWFAASQVLRHAPAHNAEALANSGSRNPRLGKLGVVEEVRWRTRHWSMAIPSATSSGSKIHAEPRGRQAG